MSKPLRVVDVSKHFGSTAAVDGVSFEAAAGELFFLLGPSGCGKTTLLRSVAGFAEPDSGTITLGDRDITRLPPHQRNTAMVFQSYALWPHMTVLENVAFGLRLRGINRRQRNQQAMQTLEWVQMRELASRKPNQLSGGQQQRVALARALAVDPDCLLLDEPLSNLDAKLRLEMRSEIQRIHHQTSLTILYVTHDQKEALSLADRVALMRDGKIVQVGTPREMYHRPTSRFAAGFLGEANFLDGTVRSLAAAPAAEQAAGQGTWADNDRQAIVDSPLGVLSGRAADSTLAAAGQCQIMVRPEALQLRPAHDASPHSAGAASDTALAPAGLNIFAARVEMVTFLGEMEQVIVKTAATGAMLKILEVPRGRPWQVGDQVTVSFDAGAASVFGQDSP